MNKKRGLALLKETDPARFAAIQAKGAAAAKAVNNGWTDDRRADQSRMMRQYWAKKRYDSGNTGQPARP